MSLAKNIEFLRRLPGLHGLQAWNGFTYGLARGLRSPLVEVKEFGTNPGDLRMFSYVPANLKSPFALVVVLHGCGQTAASYDLGTGWSMLAKHLGFALLMPEQHPTNNAHGCFNWFKPEDNKRGHGEVCSIRQMIGWMVNEHRIDKRCVFITGLSAGGAMTSAMLAAYPEIFAAGAIIAGLPYGVATNVREALSGMFQTPARAPKELGDFVRNASKHRGPWPKVSVWHGSADHTVNPANADEIVKQWLDVHRLPSEPMSEGTIDGYPRQVWWDTDGDTVVESYTITNMAHGAPIGAAENNQRYGMEGAFLIDAGISSSYHIANFFGLTSGPQRIATPARRAAKDSPSAKLIPLVSPISTPMSDLTRLLRPQATASQASKPAEKPKDKPRQILDISQVITRALAAAGLRNK